MPKKLYLLSICVAITFLSGGLIFSNFVQVPIAGSEFMPASTCSDNIQNGDEEGIDCGGNCPNECECIEDLIFEDDFSDGDISDWTIQVGNWWVKDGHLMGTGISYILAPASLPTSYMITGRFNQPSNATSKEADVLFNVKQINGHNNGQMCQIQNRVDNNQVNPYCWDTPNSCLAFYYDQEQTDPYGVAPEYPEGINPGQWYNFRLIVEENHILYYLEDEIMLDLWMEERFIGNQFGFKTYPSGAGVSYFDDIKVYKWCGCYDNDNDGYEDISCGGDDFDDSDPSCYPGAPEICDGKDNNGDDIVDEGFADFDSDGLADCVDLDDDEDGVDDEIDKCQWTALPDGVPTKGNPYEELRPNNYADLDGDGIFETNTGSKNSPVIEDSSYTLSDTFGCNCEQILFCKPGNNEGELLHGCSSGTMNVFTSQTGWYNKCFSVNAGELNKNYRVDSVVF